MMKVDTIEQLSVRNEKMLVVKLPSEVIEVGDTIVSNSDGLTYIVNGITMPTNPLQLNTIALLVTQVN